MLTVLGGRLWAPFAKVSFDAFLVHYGILIGFLAIGQHEVAFGTAQFFYYFLALLPLTWIAAFMLALLMECPLINLNKLMMAGKR